MIFTENYQIKKSVHKNQHFRNSKLTVILTKTELVHLWDILQILNTIPDTIRRSQPQRETKIYKAGQALQTAIQSKH